MKRLLIAILAFCFLGLSAVAQKSSRLPEASSPRVQTGPGAPTAMPHATTSPEFLKAADEVLAEMSKLLDLPVKEPLKKSLRTREEIRQYLIREANEDKTPAERYADDRTVEAFGLVPKGFPLDSFMIDLLTEQVAGLYDPKTKEFYIADWIPLAEQRVVMAHELTHALDDQNFNIDTWEKAARPNDDGELARDAVIEGSALAAMLDYSFRDQNTSVRDLPDVAQLIRSQAVGEMQKDPQLAKAPPFIQDLLLFPYLSGTTFSQAFLKANTGWTDFRKVFANPPISTQQILHPEDYLNSVKPAAVALPGLDRNVPPGWKKLDENVLGEFGLLEVLKQFIGQDRAQTLSPAWTGDRYATFENEKTKATLLVFRLALDNEEDTARFFGQYSEALETKYQTRTELFRRPNFFQFNTPEGGVFLRCMASQCLTVEGINREVFDRIDRSMGWPPAPAPAEPPMKKSVAIAASSPPAAQPYAR